MTCRTEPARSRHGAGRWQMSANNMDMMHSPTSGGLFPGEPKCSLRIVSQLCDRSACVESGPRRRPVRCACGGVARALRCFRPTLFLRHVSSGPVLPHLQRIFWDRRGGVSRSPVWWGEAVPQSGVPSRTSGSGGSRART